MNNINKIFTVLITAWALSACTVARYSKAQLLPLDPRELRAPPIALNNIEVCKTRRSDLLAQIGSPQAKWVDAQLLTYNWGPSGGERKEMCIPDGFGGVSCSTWVNWFPDDLTLIQLDDDGVTQRIENILGPDDVDDMGQFLREWVAGAPVQKQKPQSKVSVIFRINSDMPDIPDVDSLRLMIAGFENGGEFFDRSKNGPPAKVKRMQRVDRKLSKDGWRQVSLYPGTYYMAFFPYSVWRSDDKDWSVLRWALRGPIIRLDVPNDTENVYVGSLNLKSDRSRNPGEDITGAEIVIEAALAHQILPSHLNVDEVSISPANLHTGTRLLYAPLPETVEGQQSICPKPTT